MYLVPFSLNAQINVETFEKSATGEALTKQIKDFQGDVCAVIRISARNLDEANCKKLRFYTDKASEVREVTYPEIGVIQFYISPKAMFLRIASDVIGSTEYNFTEIIESKRDYKMVIGASTIQDPVKENYLVLTVEPKDALVEIDGHHILLNSEGKLTNKMFIVGKHKLTISSPLFHTHNGEFEIKNEKVFLTISLKPNYGFLNITSDPESEANIYINGKLVGKTPFNTDRLESGSYKVMVVKDMYLKEEKEILVTDNKTGTVKLTMQPNFAEPTFKTDPNAEIWINDIKKGTGTWKGRLAAGAYQVEAKLASHRTIFKSITLTNGETQTIDLGKPTPIYGKLNITSTPDDATITLNGKEYDKTPALLQNLLIGNYALTLSKKGCLEVSKQIVIEENKTTTHHFDLPTGREIKITSTPSGARVTIDGTFAGTTPITTTLSFGNHAIIVEKEGEKKTETITVNESGYLKFNYDVTKKPTGKEVQIISTPSGAYVTIDGVYSGVTPIYTTLTYGNHNIIIEKNGEKKTETITISEYGKTKFEFDVVKITTVTGISGRVYKTVKIGTQIWMAENLDETKYDTKSERDGATLSTSSVEVYTPYYTNSTITNGGKFYNWAAAVGLTDGKNQTREFSGKRQGICPNGWHVPTDAEWTIISNYLGSGTGSKLKSTSGWKDKGNGTNVSGFNAIQSSSCKGRQINNIDSPAYFWTSSASSGGYAWNRYLSYISSEVGKDFGYMDYGFSVRCVKD